MKEATGLRRWRSSSSRGPTWWVQTSFPKKKQKKPKHAVAVAAGIEVAADIVSVAVVDPYSAVGAVAVVVELSVPSELAGFASSSSQCYAPIAADVASELMRRCIPEMISRTDTETLLIVSPFEATFSTTLVERLVSVAVTSELCSARQSNKRTNKDNV